MYPLIPKLASIQLTVKIQTNIQPDSDTRNISKRQHITGSVGISPDQLSR